MNIIFPIGGKGSRFLQEGYHVSKPLIKVFNKSIMRYLVERISVDPLRDHVYVIYYNGKSDHIHGPLQIEKNELASDVFYNLSWGHKVTYIPIDIVTNGVLETLAIGISREIIDTTLPVLILDCDIFYGVDILPIFRDRFSDDTNSKNFLLYFKDDGNLPEYSYIQMDETSKKIYSILEKEKTAGCFANAGAYAFHSWKEISIFLQNALNNMSRESYLSNLVNLFIESANHDFYGIPISAGNVYNLGTPEKVKAFKDSRVCMLFDLDGTLVKSDELYFQVWKTILAEFRIVLSPELYGKTIQGQSDYIVKKRYSLPQDVETLSLKKDTLFGHSIEQIELINGATEFLNDLFWMAYPIVIVTNCNRSSAELVINHYGLDKYLHGLVIGCECSNPKPAPDPYWYAIEKVLDTNPESCVIFEDSKTGLLSATSCRVKMIVGLATTYESKELYQMGCNKALIDYHHTSARDILSFFQTKDPTNTFDVVQLCISEKFQNRFPVSVANYKLKGGFISDVIAFSITSRFHYVLKLENKVDNPIRSIANDLKLYDTEYYFYNVISGMLNIRTPQSLGVINDTKYGIKGIILENMLSQGFIIHDSLENQELFVIDRYIKTMVDLHLCAWGIDIKTLFPKLQTIKEHDFSWGNFIRARWPNFYEKWNFMMSEDITKICKYIVDHFDEIEEYMCEGDHLTLCHGDFKAPNTFFHPLKQECVLIDWQYVNYGKGVQDLVFFLIESFDVSFMSPWFKNYAVSYYYLLVKAVQPTYDYDTFKKDLKMSSYYFPFFVAIWFGTIDQDSLLDKNFPFFFIQRLFNFYSLF